MRIFLLLSIFICLSCSSKKDVVYIQDISNSNNYFNNYDSYKISIGDILNISLMTENPDEILLANQTNTSSFNNNKTRESLILEGFLVNESGEISYPQIGNFKASGFTVNEFKNELVSRLEDSKILVNPILDVKIVNWNFTILGDVNKPGKYFFDEPNFNILQAIGLAGDLNITGVRDDIKLLRRKNQKLDVYNIDLTKSDFLTSDAFQIISGDIILVNQNNTKIKTAGIIGNSGTLLSLLSFILSSIIVISR